MNPLLRRKALPLFKFISSGIKCLLIMATAIIAIGLVLIVYVLHEDIIGTTIEFLNRYPRAEHIVTTYAISRGSSQYAPKVYLYWSPDSPATVKNYYWEGVDQQYRPRIYDASNYEMSSGFCSSYYWKPFNPCEVLKRFLPKDFGSIIVYSHIVWTG